MILTSLQRPAPRGRCLREYWALFAVALDCRSRYRSSSEALSGGSLGVARHGPHLHDLHASEARQHRPPAPARRHAERHRAPFHVSPDAVGRHRRHMRTATLKVQAAADKQDLVYGQTLIEEVKAIKADAERLQLEAEGRRDIRAAPGNPRARGDRRVAGEA